MLGTCSTKASCKRSKLLPDSLKEVKNFGCVGGCKTKACWFNKLAIKFTGSFKYCNGLNCCNFEENVRLTFKKLIQELNMLQSLTQVHEKHINLNFLI